MALLRPTTLEEFLHPISSHVAPLCALADRATFVGGTAVIIAPGLAITASHVFEEIRKQFGYTESSKNVSLDILIPQLSTGACWYVSNMAAWVGTDITVLTLRPRNETAQVARIEPLSMTVDPPLPDTVVTALGYPGTKLLIPRNDSDVLHLSLSVAPMLSEGIVTEIHASFRDKANIRFPCFAVNAEFPAGMSGGAVFNERRQLCGLVCAGGEGELKGNSYATSIWPMTIIPVIVPEFMPPDEGLVSGQSCKLLELARCGYLALDGHERIAFFKHENGTDGVRRHHPSHSVGS